MSTPSTPPQHSTSSYLAQRNKRYSESYSTRAISPDCEASMGVTNPTTSSSRKHGMTSTGTRPPKRPKKSLTTTSASTPGSTDLKDKLTSVVSITTRGGPERKARTVMLHVGLLSHKSPYLRSLALSSLTPDIKLLDLDSDAFAIFAGWVYTSSINFSIPQADSGDILDSVCETWSLSQILQCPEFGNAVLKHACSISAEYGLVFRNEAINAIYRRTEPGDGVRKWIVDEWVWQYDSENVGDLDGQGDFELCKGFLFDVVLEQARRIGGKAKKHLSPGARPKKYSQQ